jgi:hypothetical protein
MNLLKHIFEMHLQLLILCSLVEFTDKMPACLKNLRTEAQRSITKVLFPKKRKKNQFKLCARDSGVLYKQATW